MGRPFVEPADAVGAVVVGTSDSVVAGDGVGDDDDGAGANAGGVLAYSQLDCQSLESAIEEFDLMAS